MFAVEACGEPGLFRRRLGVFCCLGPLEEEHVMFLVVFLSAHQFPAIVAECFQQSRTFAQRAGRMDSIFPLFYTFAP